MTKKTTPPQSKGKTRNTIQVTISPAHKAMVKGIAGLQQKSLQDLLEGWIEKEAEGMGLTVTGEKKETNR